MVETILTSLTAESAKLTTDLAAKTATKLALEKTALKLAARLSMQKSVRNVLGGGLAAYAGSHFMPAYQALQGQVNDDEMKNGMADNLAANIHQVGMVGMGVTTPDKKLIYHTFIKESDPSQTDFTIYNDIGSAYNYRTVAISRDAFHGNTKVQRIKFAESRSSSYDSYAPLLLTIPAFRCYLLQSRQGGYAPIGMVLEDADGIERLRTVDSDGTERVYDLQGRRVSETTKGIVIKNGKKIINK